MNAPFGFVETVATRVPTRRHHAAFPLVALRQFQGLRGDEYPHPI